MKIAIFSDSHDNSPNLEKFLNWCKKNGIEQLIFCGDLSAPSTIKEILGPDFNGPIHMVFGNVGDQSLELKVAAQFSQINHYGDVGEVELDKKKIAFTHFPEKAKKLARSGKYEIVFHGHTHKPWIEELKINPRSSRGQKLKIVYLVNPGTLAGMFYKATFAIYDTKNDKLELKILEQL